MAGILFDARVIRPGMTGIGNYARSLLCALPREGLRIGVLLPADSPYAGDFSGCTVHFSRVGLTSHPATELYEQFWITWFCRRHGYDRFASFEGRVPFFRGGLRTYPFIYDLAYRRIPGSHGLKYSLLLRLSQWIARRTATRIVTISETVKRQIAADLRVDPARIVVAHPSDSGLDEFPPTPVREAKPPFLLATSMTNRRKNLDTLLDAFAILRDERPDIQLVITGSPEWIDERLAANPVPAVLNAGFAEEGELRHLYEHAAAFVYPSFDEGFGIPLLDAALRRTPVACSDLAVFREVLGDDAEYFDPASPESMALSLRRALSGAATRADSARLRARFSWEGSALKLLNGLDE